MKRVCKICGETEQEHHDPDWLEIQDRCVCDWREWDYDKMERLPPVCEEFVGDERYGCQRCEHDKVKKQPPDLTAGEFNRREC